MSFAIRTYGLTKKFQRTNVLNGLYMDIPDGSIYGLVGSNGAGKTTTIKVLMNIFGPTSGRSEVLDADSRKLSPRQFSQIGYVSENQEMPDWMTVGYFLHYFSQFYPTWDRTLADELVKQFQLPLDRKLRHLSHGMRMKAALASSLAYRPKLMVLDEPFTGLDALVRDELIEGFLPRAENTTILISSHDLTEIESFASHIGYLDRGRLQFSEELDTLSGRFREVFVAFSSTPRLPEGLPASWMQPEVSGSAVRFIESRFDAERTPADVRRVLPGSGELAVNGMPLRAIFVALAKSSRTEA